MPGNSCDQQFILATQADHNSRPGASRRACCCRAGAAAPPPLAASPASRARSAAPPLAASPASPARSAAPPRARARRSSTCWCRASSCASSDRAAISSSRRPRADRIAGGEVLGEPYPLSIASARVRPDGPRTRQCSLIAIPHCTHTAKGRAGRSSATNLSSHRRRALLTEFLTGDGRETNAPRLQRLLSAKRTTSKRYQIF